MTHNANSLFPYYNCGHIESLAFFSFRRRSCIHGGCVLPFETDGVSFFLATCFFVTSLLSRQRGAGDGKVQPSNCWRDSNFGIRRLTADLCPYVLIPARFDRNGRLSRNLFLSRSVSLGILPADKFRVVFRESFDKFGHLRPAHVWNGW